MNFIGPFQTTKYQEIQDRVKKKMKKTEVLKGHCKNLLIFAIFLINDFAIYNSMNSIIV